MGAYRTEDIRNIALVGHSAAGKTTLVEALLHHAGAIPSPGSVEKGTAVCDYDPEERDYRHSLSAAVVGCEYHGRHLNLIDTPGLPDFLGHTFAALPAVETIAVVVNAQTGIEAVTRRVMDWAAANHFCRMIVVSKVDAADSNLPRLLDEIRDAFGRECLPLNLPAKDGESIVDCFFHASAETRFSSARAAHTALVDQVVELDEGLMDDYLAKGDIEPDKLHDPFEKALREGHLMPVCFTSARTGAGIKELLEVFAELAPNPREGNPHPFRDLKRGEDAEIHPEPVADPQHILAHVFKVTHDPYVGKLGVFRIHQGVINKDTQLFVDEGRKPFKVGHLFRVQGKQYLECDDGVPGDIRAVGKIEEIHLDAILHNSHDEDGVRPALGKLPAPMVGLAIEAATRGDEQKLFDALEKLTGEDPCLVLERSAHDLVLRAMGELHLRIALERIEKRYHVEVKTHPPAIPYRETITHTAEGHHRHKKQTGGAGQFGEVFLRIEPLPRGAGFEFVDGVVGGAIPNQFIPAVEKGVRQALAAGALAGYPIEDVRVTVHGGKHHPVDSQEVSFITAGRKAVLDAFLKAGPILLEPIVHVQVTVPSANVGDITGDLAQRRGRINDTQPQAGGMVAVSALVPLGEMSDYASRLKSLTGGEGAYGMESSHYEPLPPPLQQKLAKQYRPNEEA